MRKITEGRLKGSGGQKYGAFEGNEKKKGRCVRRVRAMMGKHRLGMFGEDVGLRKRERWGVQGGLVGQDKSPMLRREQEHFICVSHKSSHPFCGIFQSCCICLITNSLRCFCISLHLSVLLHLSDSFDAISSLHLSRSAPPSLPLYTHLKTAWRGEFP